jgi:phenylacetic acid degradation operon negative regulatory protein
MPPDAIRRILADQQPLRTWSVVVTIFGDVVVPRGGSIWLGSLLQIFAAMGVASGAVRTAISRLTSEGWLERSRDGRNSHYTLGPRGRADFAAAAQRIYGPHSPAWDGTFDLLLPDGEADVTAPSGYTAAAAGVWIAPNRVPGALDAGRFLRLSAQADPDTARRIVARIWPLRALAESYAGFVEAFDQLGRVCAAGEAIAHLDALVARILLIHAYRRIVLRDPMLPAALLPDAWAGFAARALCASLYRHLLPGAEAWLDSEGRGEDGKLPPAEPGLWARFATCYENTGHPENP